MSITKRALLALLILACAIPAWAQDGEAGSIPVVAPGDEGVSGSSLAAFEAKYSQSLVMGENTQPAGQRTVSVAVAEGELQMTTTLEGQMTVSDQVEVAKDSFLPLRRTVDSPMIKKTETFADGKCTGEMSAGGGDAQPIDIPVEGARFDGNSLDLVIATLPLAEGYRAHLPIFSSDFGPAQANLWADVSVQGKESVEVGGETYETWVVEKVILDAEKNRLSLQGQPMPAFKAWIVSEAPYVVKMSMGPMQAELMAAE